MRVEKIAKGDDKGKWRVIVEGFDYYNTKTGGIESGGSNHIAVKIVADRGIESLKIMEVG